MAEEVTEERTVDDALASVLGVGGASEGETPEETTATPEVPAEGATEDAGIVVAGKTYANYEEVAKALENANALISSRQEPEVAEEPEVTDPWDHVPGLPAEAKKNLYDWAVDKPLEAAQWAWQNPEAAPQEIIDQLIAHGKLNAPAGWDRFLHAENVAAAERIASQSTERFARSEENAIAQSAEAELRATLGAAYEAYEPRINERIEQQRYVKPAPGTPVKEAVQQVFMGIYRDLWLEDNYEALQASALGGQPAAAAAPAAAPVAVAPPVTTPLTAAPGGAATIEASDDVVAAVNRALGLV